MMMMMLQPHFCEFALLGPAKEEEEEAVAKRNFGAECPDLRNLLRGFLKHDRFNALARRNKRGQDIKVCDDPILKAPMGRVSR